MYIEDLKAHTENSELIINAGIKNLFSFVDKNAEKPWVGLLSSFFPN